MNKVKRNFEFRDLLRKQGIVTKKPINTGPATYKDYLMKSDYSKELKDFYFDHKYHYVLLGPLGGYKTLGDLNKGYKLQGYKKRGKKHHSQW